MYCKKCGTKNDEDARFCFKCGAALTNLDSSVNVINRIEENVEEEEKLQDEFDDFQKIYVRKLSNELLNGNILEELDLDEIYEKAKKYGIDQVKIGKLIKQLKSKKDEIFKFINMIYEETPDFVLNDELREQIVDFGEKLDLSEEQIEFYINQYVLINKIDEKAKVYKQLCKLYIGSLLNNSKQDAVKGDGEEKTQGVESQIENIKLLEQELIASNDTKSKEIDANMLAQFEGDVQENNLTKEEYEQVLNKVKRNVDKINDIIEKQYTKQKDGVELPPEKVGNICEIGQKYGIDSYGVTLLIFAIETQNGIFDKRQQRFKAEFNERVNKLAATNIILCDEERRLEGKYVLKFDILRWVVRPAEKAVDIIETTKANQKDALEVIIKKLTNACSKILDNVEKIAKTLDIEDDLWIEDGPYITYELTQYVLEKCNDIVAASEACQNAKEQGEYMKLYREFRKEGRSKWVGGGFGIEGALKGAVDASILNAGSGLVHSVINAVGNIQTDNEVQRVVVKVVKTIREDIVSNLVNITKHIAKEIIERIYKKHPESFWKVDKDEANNIRNRFVNSEVEYKKELAWEFLKSNPENVETYVIIYENYANRNTKEQLIAIARLFEIGEEVREAIENWLRDKALDLDMGGSEENIGLFVEYMSRRCDDPDWRREEIFNGLEYNTLKIERDNYRQLARNIIEYDKKQDVYSFEPFIRKRILENQKKIVGNSEWQISSNAMTIISEKNQYIYKETIDLAEMLEAYHKLLDACLEEKLIELSKNLPLNSYDDAKKLINKLNKLSERYFENGSINTWKCKILFKRFEWELENNREVDKLQQLLDLLKKFQDDWLYGVHALQKLEDQYTEKIELSARMVYDYCTDYQKGQDEHANLTLKKKGILCQSEEEAKGKRDKLAIIYKYYKKCDMKSYDRVQEYGEKIAKIYKETGVGKDIAEEMGMRLWILDEDQRTVLGKTYDTIEEAEHERQFVAGNTRYDTVEEAKEEQEKIDKESERINTIEFKCASNARRLLEIKKQHFVTTEAKIKEKYYESIIVKRYYEALETKKEVEQGKRTSTLCFWGGIVAVIVGIGPFLASGLIMKIIVGGIVGMIWAKYSEEKEFVKSMEGTMKELNEIESLFVIDGNEAHIKKRLR